MTATLQPPPLPPMLPDTTPGEDVYAQLRFARTRRLIGVALALAIIGISLVMDFEVAFIVPVLFILVVPFEKLFPRHSQRIRRPEVGTDIGYALAGSVLNVVAIVGAIVVAVISLAWIPGLLLRPIVGLIPGVALPFVGIALFDLAIYWTHRWYHEVPVLWRCDPPLAQTHGLDQRLP